MKAGLSSIVYHNEGTLRSLNIIKAAGFGFVEIYANQTDLDPREQRISPHTVKSELINLGLTPHTIHLPFNGVDIGVTDNEERRFAISLIKASMEDGVKIGAGTGILHPNAHDTVIPGSTLAEERDAAYESVSEIVEFASRVGIRIAVENLFTRLGGRFGCKFHELQKMVLEINSPILGICLDTGHATIEKEDIPEAIKTIGDKLFNIHLHDTDGLDDRHWVPGQGIIDWYSVREALESINYQYPWMMEVQKSTQPGNLAELAIESAKCYLG